ncbi:heterodisulfide reductase-related iron-sulfur binding cluster [Streptomyces mirabilis]|uniref:heterodisulfide reductase-related iron-sulfur binding cluster n=1 Tax=Streptomyces mirabilis TaxID=68239 RepID=UPI003652D677
MASEQTCCGQPQYNTGHRRETEPLVHRMAEAFDGYDYVVAPSGSYVAWSATTVRVRAAAEERGNEPADQARSPAGRVHEFTEFLGDALGVTDIGAYFPQAHASSTRPCCRCPNGSALPPS